MRSSLGIRVAVGVGVGLLLIVLYVRARDRTIASAGPATSRERVEQRLRQLNEAHNRARRDGSANGATIGARSGVAPKAQRVVPRAAAGQGPSTHNADAPDSDVPSESIDLDTDPDDIPTLK